LHGLVGSGKRRDSRRRREPHPKTLRKKNSEMDVV